MTEAELKSVLEQLRQEQSDNSKYEAKAAKTDFPMSAAKTICAFSNMPGGGTILFGIDENRDFNATGVYDVKKCQQMIAAYSQKEYTVPVLVDISMLQIDGVSVIVADVHEARKTMKPVRYRKTGTSFIRQYDSDFELSAVEEKLFEKNQGMVHYDEEPVSNTSISDLNKDITDGYISNRKRYSDILAAMGDEEVLLRTGIVLHTGELSTAGLLALGKYPQQHFPNYTIKASVRKKEKTDENVRAANVRSFDGPIPIMLANANRWVLANSDEYTLDLDDGSVSNVCEYPLVTCREMIANALIHRDLSPCSMIETISLIMEDERLILSNPGGLFGISIHELGKSASRTRNSRLAEICQYVPAERGSNVIEKLGSGILKMYSAQDRYRFRRPTFIDGEIYFTVVLRKGIPVKNGNGRMPQVGNLDIILNALRKEALSRTQIERVTLLTTAQVRHALAKLMKDEKVVRIGKDSDPNCTYRTILLE